MVQIGIFSQDFKSFLENKGYTNIYRDDMTENSDCIGLILKEHENPPLNDGTGTRLYEVQVRRENADDAYSVAYDICNILNSGPDKDMIFLSDERWCIATPKTLPTKLKSTNEWAIYSFEIALWGANDK